MSLMSAQQVMDILPIVRSGQRKGRAKGVRNGAEAVGNFFGRSA